MRTVKCAVVGTGWWGTTAHVPALKQHPQAELAAVHSANADMARQVAVAFRVPQACTTLEEVLAIKELDAVVISSTPNAHYSQALAALRRGLHVLIEKPMTINAAESQELVCLAEKQGVHFLVSCPWHYTAHSREARRLIQSGALGQLKMISILMTNFNLGLYRGLPWEQIFGGSPTPQNSAKPHVTPGRSSYSDPAVAGGGQIYCQISHVAAHLGFLTERPPIEVHARFDNADTAVDVYNVLTLELTGGTLVSIASAGATPDSQRNYEVRVYGTQGVLLMELWKGRMECHLFDGGVTRYPDLAEAEIYPMFAPAENLVDIILGHAANGSPVRLGLYAMNVIEAACESVRTRSSILLRSPGR